MKKAGGGAAPRASPAKRAAWGEKEQGSGLCDDEAPYFTRKVFGARTRTMARAAAVYTAVTAITSRAKPAGA